MSIIDQIKANLSIIDVLQRYSGTYFFNERTNRRQFNIRCPFHNDRNPSFTIYTKTGTFRCWSGCNDGKSGDVIDIVKLSRGVDTKQAIKILIADYDLGNPDSDRVKECQKRRTYWKRVSAFKTEKNKKIIEAINALHEVKQLARVTLGTILEITDLDKVGELYHVVGQIDYWFECLAENEDTQGQIKALQEVSRFIHNIKVGEGRG
ncbi:CHC2 zinc finger domain-containing protein [Neobacillus vireti]|uniref:CHC2 zinc finger domain-containing protein n=1 Tax=Neobacillus vireti TaxID=220686 RepID=UPI00300023A6